MGVRRPLGMKLLAQEKKSEELGLTPETADVILTFPSPGFLDLASTVFADSRRDGNKKMFHMLQGLQKDRTL